MEVIRTWTVILLLLLLLLLSELEATDLGGEVVEIKELQAAGVCSQRVPLEAHVCFLLLVVVVISDKMRALFDCLRVLCLLFSWGCWA